jgi:SAM-dependent methyltransferase
MDEPNSASVPGGLPLTMSTAMATVTQYHAYLWAFVTPWLGQRVLEIGVGFGHYTRRMLADGRHVLACDLEPGHLEDLRTSTQSALLQIQRFDLEEPQAGRAVCASFAPDTIVMLNVLEHVRGDEHALAFLREIATPGGRIVLIVPALPALYNGLDREAGHHRRYTLETIEAVLGAAGWAVVSKRYLNLPGVPGWIAAGWLGRVGRSGNELNAPSTNWLLRVYDRFFVGLSRLTDRVIGPICGLSVLAVARRP